jgi:predicted AAA+ superfamily ATPase
MQRLITKKLIEWKSKSDRKPLILRGARQVGKSYVIADFGKQYFEGEVHIINFEKRPDWKSVFDKNFEISRIISELEILVNMRINIGKDLLFFDEIQECPKAIISLRYFYEQTPELHVIGAGSLLEFALKDISFPVGRVQLLSMYPLNFYEFLLATGKQLLSDTILEKPGGLSPNIHNLLLDELKKYFFIGGMPECVKKYVETNSMVDVFDIQSDLINTFRQDFSKYATYSNKRCLNSVLDSVSKNVGRQIKYSNLAEGFTNPTIKKAFELLETARLFKRVCSSNPNGIPINANRSEKTFKAIMLDIGLFSRLSGFSISTEFNKTSLLSIFKGAMAEQFIGQEMISAGHIDLHYWSRQAKSSTAEVDFLIEKQNEIIPIEVKSGAGGSLRSLHLLLNTYPNIKKGFVFSEASFGEISNQKLVFIPLYYAYAEALNEN